MSIQIVREQRIAYTESGLSSVHDDLYIKLDSGLADWLQRLQGAKLSSFLYIALSEAPLCAHHGEPATLKRIASGTGFSERAVLYAVQWLAENEFIAEGEPTATGAKTYRPKAFAWFGRGEKSAPPAPGSANCTPLQHMNDDDVHTLPEDKISSIHECETREILQSCHPPVEGENLDLLARTVDPDLAQRWVEWAESQPAGFKQPVAYLVKMLKANPRREPSPLRRATESPRQAHFQGEFYEKYLATKNKE